MDRSRNTSQSHNNQAALHNHNRQHQQQQQQQQLHHQQQQKQQPSYDHRYHYHIGERPMNTVKYMDKKPKSILCNSSGIIVAEMVYRCLRCSVIFETPLDCRTHFRCFHANWRENKPRIKS